MNPEVEERDVFRSGLAGLASKNYELTKAKAVCLQVDFFVLLVNMEIGTVNLHAL